MTSGAGARDPHASLDVEMEEGRYARLSMIPWWDQTRLARAKVVVVGAGALGNEILKNLALLGVGTILVIDLDTIETSNLSRSVLYRASDEGRSKAEAAAEAVRDLNPDVTVHALNADVTGGVGLGVFRWADVVICGLDSREARLAVNRACWKVDRPWVDGAIESFQGVARVFRPPDGVCYECTLGDLDQKLMAARNSCGFLMKEAYRRGGTPTTPTTAAVIAGIEVQEAVKLLHPDAGLSDLVGRGYFFDGSSYDCFTIQYVRRDDCLSHETFDDVVETALTSDTASLADVIGEARKLLPDDVVIDLPGEMVTGLRCGECGATRALYRLLSAVDVEEARCRDCARLMVPEVAMEARAGSPFASIALADLGFGPLEILTARSGEREVHIEISGDRGRLFGERI